MYLLFDVCALAEHLIHNNFEGFSQEELALGVVDERFTQVITNRSFLPLHICCSYNKNMKQHLQKLRATKTEIIQHTALT